MVKEDDCVAIFHSAHRVLKAEKILLEAALTFKLIPAPRQLGADCGLALCFAPALRDEITKVLAQESVEIVELWTLQSGDYVRIA